MAIHYHLMQLGDGVPEMVHLLPAGVFKTNDGRGPFRLDDPQAVIAASMPPGTELAFDTNHATDLAAPKGGDAPAVGWIKALEARPDGIWGRVEWNEDGQQLLAKRSYRSVSPVFTTDKAGAVTGILRASLTNNPALPQLTHLSHLESPRMDMAKLRAALGLPETATEADILAAVAANHQAVTTHTAQLRAITQAAGVEVGVAHADLVGKITAAHASAAEVVRLTAQVTGLQTQLATFQGDAKKAAATAFIEQAIKAGKPILAMRDFWLAQHEADPAQAEKAINALPSINGGNVVMAAANPGGTGEPDGDELTAEERRVVEKMNLDPKKLVEQRKKSPAGKTADGRAA